MAAGDRKGNCKIANISERSILLFGRISGSAGGPPRMLPFGKIQIIFGIPPAYPYFCKKHPHMRIPTKLII